MASVFEFLGVKAQSTYTLVPRLGINNKLYQIQKESEIYFRIPKTARASDEELAVHINENQHFLSTNEAHTLFLDKCINLFKEKSTQLHDIDKKLLGSVALSVGASTLSFLPLMGFLSWVGWGATIYYMNQRATAYAEYHESLTLLVGACNWSLGESKENRQDPSDEQLIKNESIRKMMIALYPVLTHLQIQHLIADDLEDMFTEEARMADEKYQLGFNPNTLFSKKDDIIALNKKGAEFNRCIYGFNKGGVADFFDAIFSILPDLYQATLYGFKELKHWWQAKNHPMNNNEELSSPGLRNPL